MSQEVSHADSLADVERVAPFEKRAEAGHPLGEGRHGGHDHCGPGLRVAGQGRQHSEASVARLFVARLPLEGQELGSGVEEDGRCSPPAFVEKEVELLRVALGVLRPRRHHQQGAAWAGRGEGGDDVRTSGIRYVQAQRGHRLGQRIERLPAGGEVQRQ